jgi:drug/metabolite transporter (DMT)-like permease
MRFTTWVILLATLLLWSGNWIVARAVRHDISPGLATVFREAIVVAVLGPFVWAGLRRKIASLTRRDWTVVALLGLAGGGPHLALQWLGLHYTTAASGVLYLSTTPIFILLIQIPLGERISLRRWAGVAVSFAGVAIIATQGNLGALSFNVGDLCALASMMMWACYTVLLGQRRDALGVTELLVLVCAFGALFMLPWIAYEALAGAKLALSVPGAMAVLYSAIGSMLLAFAGWSYVVQRMGPSRAGATMHLMPAIGIALSALFLREYPSWFHFVGIAMILAGVATASSVSRTR